MEMALGERLMKFGVSTDSEEEKNINVKPQSREDRQKFILEAPVDDVFSIEVPHYKAPQKARIFNTVICENCGEGVKEDKIRLCNGKKLCLDCVSEYSRGWE